MDIRFDPMASVMASEGDDGDVAGIPFPAGRGGARLDFPPMLDSDSCLGEVLAFIRSAAERPAGGTSSR